MLKSTRGYDLKHRTSTVKAALQEEPGDEPPQRFSWSRLIRNTVSTFLASLVSAASSWGILWWVSDVAGLELAALGPWLGIPGVILVAGHSLYKGRHR